MASILGIDGTTTDFQPRNGTTFSLEELQAAVGGYIEPLHTATGYQCRILGKLYASIKNF